jgi:hypothetical protein
MLHGDAPSVSKRDQEKRIRFPVKSRDKSKYLERRRSVVREAAL